jgi:hypothetical protein
MILFSLATSALTGTHALAADPDSKGTDFWIGFPTNYLSPPTLSLFITGDTNTLGTVDIPGIAFSTPFAVTAGIVTTVSIPVNAQMTAVDAVENRGIHVTALAEVTVYGLSRIPATTDAYLGLPTDILGTEYITLGYKNVNVLNGTQFAIVGVTNGTTVTITPSVTTGIHPAGVPYNVVMNQGETYQLRNTNVAPADVSGTIITATNPIAVFGGHQCANIPQGFTFCDHLVEELPPTSAWGKSFVTMPLATRLRGDTFRILASVNGTAVNVNGVLVATLNRGQYHEQLIAGPSQITASQPVLVAQYSNSSLFDNVTSDPFEMLIPPFEQFLGSYTVSTPASGFRANFINVVAPNAAIGLVTLDGLAIPPGSFTAIGASGFSGAQVPVTLGSHHLEASLPFGAFVYGFDEFDSYGYPGGMSLAPIARVTSVTLAPKTATNLVGTQHCVTATVLDQNSNPLTGVRVDFAVTGANPTSGFALTDSSGHASFCYSGANSGDDVITASVGSLSDTAAKTWATGGGCTLSQGYWKNHPEAWPVTSLTLGTVAYDQAQLLQIMSQPVRGNGLVSLSHQLIGAKLNAASGVGLPSDVVQAIADADTLIDGQVVPPIGNGSLAPGATDTLTSILDVFNNGDFPGGPLHCSDK